MIVQQHRASCISCTELVCETKQLSPNIMVSVYGSLKPVLPQLLFTTSDDMDELSCLRGLIFGASCFPQNHSD